MEAGTATAARGLTTKGRGTRQRIIDAAADLMVSRGVAAVSLDEVGRVTSTSKSQMYHYFESKEALTAAVVACVGDQIVSFQAGLLAPFDGFDDLERWAAGIVAHQRAQNSWCGCPLGTLASELGTQDGTPKAALDNAFGEWELLLARGLGHLQSTGVLSEEADVHQLAVATLASLQGGLLLSKAARSAEPLEVALNAALDYLSGFATPSR